MMQIIAFITSFIFMLMIAGVFGWVALKSRERRAYDPIVKRWYKTRKFYGTGLVIFMLVLSIYTLRELPYNEPAYGASQEATVVNVEALQFGWNIDQHEFEAGERIEFRVTSADVNHAFGIYDEDMNLIEQTQAMPNYTNKVYVTFDEPGTYEIMCLEYCGVGHHMMKDELVVK